MSNECNISLADVVHNAESLERILSYWVSSAIT